MPATLSTGESRGRLVLPPLRDLDERTACMYIHTGVMKSAMQAGGERRLHATLACRRLLARATNPPVQAVIDAGLLPLLVSFLGVPELLDDTLWILINVAAGTAEQTEDVVRAGAVRPLVRLLAECSCYNHALLAAWALANIARDVRDAVLAEGAVAALVALAEYFFWRVSSAADAVCVSPREREYRLHQACACARCAAKLRTEMLRILTFALRQLCQGVPRPRFEAVEPALALLVLLARHCPDADVLGNVGWALESFVASGRGEDLGTTRSLDAALDAGVLPVLLDLVAYPAPDVSHAALNGLVMLGRAGAAYALAVVEADALQRLLWCLATKDRLACMLACDVLASVAAKGGLQALIDAHVFPVVCSVIHAAASTAVKANAAYVIRCACVAADLAQTQRLVHLGCLDALLALVRTSPDAPGILNVSLRTMLVVFGKGDASRDADGRNPYAEAFARFGGTADVAACRRHHCAVISATATAMLETYFDVDLTCHERL